MGTRRQGVFVNYRVGDRQNEAALIADGLARRLGSELVFFASRSLPVGRDFAPGLLAAVRGCEVLLAVIGPQWTAVTGPDGQRAIDDPGDWVRAEIAEALRLGIPVVPVLIGDGPPLRMPARDELPDDIAALSHMQYVRMSYQDISVDRLAERLVAASPGLAVGAAFTPPERMPDDWSPSMLLRAEYEIVPFSGRAAELAEIDRWCAHPAPAAVRLLTGPGGQGKTRLARQVCQAYRARGWAAGFVGDRAAGEVLARVGEIDAPTLAVFDYAEARTDQLTALAEAATSAGGRRRPVRLLLLARAPGEWQQLMAEHRSDAVSALFRAMTEERLAPLVTGPAERDAEYERALAAFGRHLRRDVTDLREVRPPIGGYDQVLEIHAMALTMLLDAADPGHAPAASPDPVARVLDHERRYWRRTLPRFGLTEADEDLVRVVVANATLFGARDEAEARALLTATGAFADVDKRTLTRCVRWAAGLYPGAALLNSLRPDRLGEDQVAQVAQIEPEAITGPFAIATGEQTTQALTVVGRALPRHPALSTVVTRLFATDPQRLIPAGLGVAPQLDDPRRFADAMITAIRSADDASVTEAVLAALPDSSIALADLAALATALSLDNAEEHARINPHRTARLLHLHAVHLSRAGRFVDALPFAERATALSRRLAAQDPGQKPHLARSVRTTASLLHDLGRNAEAAAAVEESIRLRRELVRTDSGEYLPELANALNLAANLFSDLGRFDDGLAAATDALAIHRRLAGGNHATHLPDLALTLLVTAGRYLDVGRFEDGLTCAEEAERVYRGLGDQYPDAYLAGAGSASSVLATALAGLGRQAEAFESSERSIGLRRGLAERYPDAYRHELAQGLVNHAVRLEAVGSHGDALRHIAEAVRIWRELAEVAPPRFRPSLATTLANQAHSLAKLGRPREGLVPAREAVAIARDLVAGQRAAHLPLLGSSVLQLTNALADAGMLEEALATGGEAVEIFRELAERLPDVHGADLGRALNSRATRLGAAGRHAEALDMMREAVVIRRGLAERYPSVHRGQLAASLNNLSIHLDRHGRYQESLDAVVEAFRHLTDLAKQLPAVHLPDLATVSSLLGTRLADLGRAEEGLPAARTAVAILRRLAESDPVTHRPDLALAFNNLSLVLNQAHRPEEAVRAGAEAVSIRRELVAGDPAQLPGLASALHNQAVALGGLDRGAEATACATEAVAAYRTLADQRPDAYPAELAMALLNLALQRGSADPARALAPAEEAVRVLRAARANGRTPVDRPFALAIALTGVLLAESGRAREAVPVLAEARRLATGLSDEQALDWADSGLRATHAADPATAEALWREHAGSDWPLPPPSSAENPPNGA
jgi:hypothetical protein